MLRSDMRTVTYSHASLVKTAFGCPALAIAGCFLLGRFGTFWNVVIALGVCTLFACGLQGLRKLYGDPTALRYDDQALTLKTMWSEATVPWREVESVGASALNSYAMYGLVKVGTTNYLEVKLKSGLFGKKYRLLSDMFDLDQAALAALIVDMDGRAKGAPALAPRPAGDPPEGQPRPAEFDADAAIARYLAQKGANSASLGSAAVSSAQTNRPAFGRKGLSA